MDLSGIKFDCINFKGATPCSFNKTDGSECPTCRHYEKTTKRILIIKLGAIGDVIRTTPLVNKYRDLYPHANITWITMFPDVLPKDQINAILEYNGVSIFTVLNETFDIAVNLDKEKDACMLLSRVKSVEKYGFTYNDHHIDLATPSASHKLLTGLFDGYSKNNTKSYLEEIFEICHLQFEREEYLIRLNDPLKKKWEKELRELANGKSIIGLNTGCGERWKTRLWPDENWVELINHLQQLDYFCILLGGPAEDMKNRHFSALTGAHYPGNYPLEEFIALSSVCDLVVTQVSLMMHIAVALKKNLVLFNNIFNRYEFELYGRGVIIEPVSGCDCYYGNSCKRETNCMHDIYPEDVVFHVQQHLPAVTIPEKIGTNLAN